MAVFVSYLILHSQALLKHYLKLVMGQSIGEQRMESSIELAAIQQPW